MERNMEPFRTNRYSRINAVNYAKTFALHPNPNFRYFPLINNETSGDCANFISQCLLAGGGPMIFRGSHPWWYRKNNTFSTKDDTWSVTWAVAHSLYWTLKVNQQSKASGIKGLEIYDPTLLELGDLIFFEGDNGNIFHSMIVTAFRNSEPLVSHHSFEALNIYYKNSWPAKHPHYLKISF